VIVPSEIKALHEDGVLEKGVWPLAYVKANYPQCVARVEDKWEIKWRKVDALGRDDKLRLGGVLFQYQCNNCHAIEQGYSPIGPLVQGWSPDMIHDLVLHLDKHRFTMPPWCGRFNEAELLTEYLTSIAPQRPTGMQPSRGMKLDDAPAGGGEEGDSGE
jgi:mono/diheme cytochrome c family protein